MTPSQMDGFEGTGTGRCGPWSWQRPFSFAHKGSFGPHGRHGHHAWGFGSLGRAKRGDVRAAILTVLAEKPMHGYEIMQQLQERSGGFWHPSAGSVYPTLQLLEDQGLVTSEEVEGRRVYSLTEAGRTEAEAAGQRAEAPPWGSWAPDDPRVRLGQAGFGLAAAVKQVLTAGSPDQVDQVLVILTDARKRIYALLAEGE
ncbi:MAG TPA: PadR family transcriptional regulator [Thermoleophilia bacterium]|nr:PadR family transcriptional regulator [Thermoleophilia bacterium]